MKYVLICPDGASDWRIPALNNQSPLEFAAMPATDALALNGRVGLARNVPKDMAPGSDVACMSLLGYDPSRYHTGRAPLETPALGLDLQPGQTAVRCNLVTIAGDDTMADFTAGHISTDEAAALMAALNDAVGPNADVRFYPGVSYRNIAIVNRTGFDATTTPPHDITGEPIKDRQPFGGGARELLEWTALSKDVFRDHPVTKRRLADGKSPATQVWLWGQGTRPALPLFADRFGKSGAMISAVALLQSIGLYAGMELIKVPGATGYIDTNYAGKASAAIDALDRHDFVFVHIEAPDEMGHEGDYKRKIQSLESIDKHIVGPVADALRKRGPYRILVSPDHPTPCELMTHTREPVPFLISGDGITPDGARRLTEVEARATGWVVENGHQLVSILFNSTLISSPPDGR